MFEALKEPFIRTALLAGLITSCLCAYLGVFVILRRVVFVGIVLSEAAALGVALGLFIGVNPSASAFILTFTAILLLSIPFAEKHISKDTLLGSTYCICAAVSVILIARNPLAETKGVNLISGSLLYANWSDIKSLAIMASIIAVIHLVSFREFIFVSFDRETALTTGLKANLSEFLLYLTFGMAISWSMKICGVVFVFASLVMPAMAGLLIAKTMSGIFILSILLAAFSTVSGVWLSYEWDLPTGASVVTVFGVILIISVMVKYIVDLLARSVTGEND
jgi:ABC-type Mn2+/Zn2+ transport system permease subunit